MKSPRIRLSGPTLMVLRAPPGRWPDAERSADIRRATRIGSDTVPAPCAPDRAGWLVGEWEKIDPSKARRPKRRLSRLTGGAQLKARKALSEFRLRT
jgi:hypothetical protein